MLNQKLQQKMLQKLSPQQIQLIKLLEVPTIQLEQRIKKEIEENPVLEEGREDEYENSQDDQGEDAQDDFQENVDEFTLEDYIDDDDEIPNYKLNVNNYSKDDKKIEIPYSVGNSFNEHLQSQLGLRVLSQRQTSLAEYIIGNMDEDGYLRRDLELMVDDLAFAANITTTEEE